MNFAKALEIIDKNKFIIGNKFKGSIIYEFIILPTNIDLQNEVIKRYIQNLNANEAITPYIDQDVDIYCVFDIEKIKCSKIFISTRINNLTEEFKIDLS